MSSKERRETFARPVGEETARAWRLYLTGGRRAFEEHGTGVDQILAVRPTTDGDSGMRAAPSDGTSHGAGTLPGSGVLHGAGS